MGRRRRSRRGGKVGGTLTELASFDPRFSFFLGGVAVGFMQDRQAGVDYFIQRSLDSLFAAAGVTFNSAAARVNR